MTREQLTWLREEQVKAIGAAWGKIASNEATDMAMPMNVMMFAAIHDVCCRELALQEAEVPRATIYGDLVSANLHLSAWLDSHADEAGLVEQARQLLIRELTEGGAS